MRNYGNDVRNAIDHLARLLQRAVQRTKPTSHKLAPLPNASSLNPALPRVQPVPLLRVPVSPVPRCISPSRISLHHLPLAAAAAHVSQSIKSPSITFALPDPSHFKHQVCNHHIAQQVFSTPALNHIYNGQTGKKETIDLLLAGPNST